MLIKKVSIDNFLSWGEGNSFNLENCGILFLKGENKDAGGSNGSGKSTIIEAIVWTLFGDTIRGVDKIDDVVNNKIGSNCKCMLELDGGYQIIRARKHNIYENRLILLKDGVDISKPSTRLTQDDINKIFNIHIDIFINSIVLANSNIRINLLDNKNNQLRRQIIEEILGINNFADYLIITKDKLKDSECIKQSIFDKINNANDQIKNYNDKIAKMKVEKETFEKEQLIEKQEFEQSKIDRMHKLNEEIEKLKSVDVKYNLDIYTKISESKELEAKINGAIGWIKRTIKDLESKKSGLNEDINKYQNFINQPCKYCGSILDKSKLQTMIVKLESEKTIIDTDVVAKQLEISEKQSSIDDIKRILLKLKPTYNESDLYTIDSDVKSIEEKIEAIKVQEFVPTKFQEVNFELDVETLVNNIELSKQKIEETSKELPYLEFWKQGFGNDGLKIYILDNMIKYLNKKVDFYLNILSKGAIKLEFDKYLDFKISGLNYRSCSSGERKRVDLAVLIALYDLTTLRYKSNYNILVLDEVLDSIDDVGIEAVKDLLLELNNRIPTIIVVSHNNLLSEYFPNTVTVVKEEGVSRLQ